MRPPKYACLLGSEEAALPAATPSHRPAVLRVPQRQAAERAPTRVTKIEAVRRAIASGAQTPHEGIPYIKREFGIDIGPTVFSTYKCRLREESLPAPRLVSVESALEETIAGETGLLDVAQTVKDLVDQYGAETVRGLVELFSNGAKAGVR